MPLVIRDLKHLKHSASEQLPQNVVSIHRTQRALTSYAKRNLLPPVPYADVRNEVSMIL